MTCRVARSYQHFAQMEPLTCSECGSMDLRVTAGTLGPHLCPICVQSLSTEGGWTEGAKYAPMRQRSAA